MEEPMEVSDKERDLEQMLLSPGTLVRWIDDGDLGFVLLSKMRYDPGFLEFKILWLTGDLYAGDTTREGFEDMKEGQKSLIVLSEPIYNRDASEYINRELSQ